MTKLTAGIRKLQAWGRRPASPGDVFIAFGAAWFAVSVAFVIVVLVWAP